jgi:hypothetical protein
MKPTRESLSQRDYNRVFAAEAALYAQEERE